MNDLLNYEKQYQQTLRDIKECGKELQELQKQLTPLQLTENQKRKISYHKGVDDRTKLVRENLVNTMNEVKNKLQDLKEKRDELHSKRDGILNVSFSKMIKECLPKDFIQKLRNEAESRAMGNEPQPIEYNFKRFNEYKDDYFKFRDLAREQMEKMIEFRIKLTGLIEKGCDQFGNAEFLKFISPLNSLIIPVKELQKIKLKHLL